ncbi:MAG: hypothetical protein U0936_09930 [Planctomycetaceae bacterium]
MQNLVCSPYRAASHILPLVTLRSKADSISMNVLALLLVTMLQNSTDGANQSVHARKETSPLSSEVVPLDEIRKRVGSGEYFPWPRSGLEKIPTKAQAPEQHDIVRNRPRIKSALYEATLAGSHITSGQVELRFYETDDIEGSDSQNEGFLFDTSGTSQDRSNIAGPTTGEPLLLGATNLQQLQMTDDQGPVTLGSDASRRLFVLRSGVPTLLSGKWSADGLVAGNVVMFRLSLPAATTAKFVLHTPPGIQVSSVGSLVLGPEISESKSTWTLIPGDSTRLTINCRPQSDLKSQESLTLNGFTASHIASGELLSSRWTIGLPTSAVQPMTITSRIPDGLRINDVSLEDRRPVEWSIASENNHSLLKMSLPRMTAGAVITISAESILPQSETWNLPMLSPSHWVSEDGQYKGLILLPLSQISVVLPSTIKLDEWTLVGIQERDVVTRPDQSREYQLTQFLPEASAVVRTSTNQPRISEALITIVEPAGRLATIRCLANVSCEAAPVVELQWPVTPGWQVIAARYASNSRSLFFETSNVTSVTDLRLLTVHLPEALEPGASRLFEIQLQQTDNTDQLSLALPLQAISEAERTASVVMFPPAFTLNTDLQLRWSMGRRSMTSGDVLQQLPWFPANRFLSGMQAFETGNSVTLTPQIYSPTNNQNGTEQQQLEHTIRVTDGLIVENSRIQIPASMPTAENLTITVPSNASSDLRWTVDGESVAARRVDDPDLTAEWKRWSIPLKKSSIDSSVVIRCESRRAVSPEFTAMIPVPDSTLPFEGSLQLFASDEGLLSVSGLVRDSQETEPQSTKWKLPAGHANVQIKFDVNPGLQSGQAIDLHVLHLISEESGSLHRELLAVANVARSSGQISLPLALPEQLRPLVLVDGHRVQLQETPTGFSIPLPQTSADCQVIVRWTESASRSRRVTGERELPRLFLNELAVPQCTHHFLVDPELELKSPANPFAAAEPAGISGILDRLLISAADGNRLMQSEDSRSVPAEIRQFIIQWQLAAVQGWKPQTLIDTVESKTAVIIQVTQLRRRLAIAIGTFLLLASSCIAFRTFTGQYRLSTAFLALGFLAVNVLVQTPVVNAILEGAFWGLSTGLTLVMLSRWKWIRAPLRGLWMQACLMIALLHAQTGNAWQSSAPGFSLSPPNKSSTAEVNTQRPKQNPDILIPDVDFSGAEIVYVRSDLIERSPRDTGEEQRLTPAAVITKLHARIVAEAANSLEVQLKLGVSAISGQQESALRIPLQGSHLVECRLDGSPVFPEPFGTDSILVRIPASSLLPPRTVEDSSFLATGDSSEISTSVDAGSLDAFTVHTIECRLRPVTSRQTSGVQFRLPSLPCPEATVEVVSPVDLYSNARAQSPEGSIQWKPASGIATLSSLGMSDGVDVRLLQNEIERGSPRSATVQILCICETNAGQQIINGICRFSKWSKLEPEVRYRVPAGFRLNTVTATTGADVITDLLWSVTDQSAVIQLPPGTGDSFVLAFQLVRLTAGDVLKQPVPVSELQQFSDCVVAPDFLLAVRTNSVFSVLPPQGNQVSTAAFPDLQSDWGQWLRRSDVVFRVPSGNETVEINLVPRISVNEVRISQNADIREGEIGWKCLIDVDTSVLPVFRHRLALTSAVVVNDVQVVAGEANRLDSWHRRGDQLVIQLKEGTTGAHSITLTGRQKIRPDDSIITLHSPHLQNAQILESSMTVQDSDGLGLSIQKLGGAVPDIRVGPGDPLPPDTPVRMQVVNETEPIVLVRARPVEPIGSMAAIRSADQVTFALHISQWSGSHGPLQLRFSDTPSFIREPFVLIEQKALALFPDEDGFAADQSVVREMFDQPEFTVIWTLPAGIADDRQRSVSYLFPDLLHEIRWNSLLLVPLDAPVGSVEHTAALKNANSPIPPWLSNAALSVGKETELKKSGLLNLPHGPDAQDSRILIPAPVIPDTGTTETIREIVSNTDTVVWSCSGQSAVGETLVLLYAAELPSKCLVKIPDETVVTEVEADESTRWDDGAHKSLAVDLLKPVTKLKLRWLGRRTETDGSSLTLSPPFPVKCVTRGFLTVFSENGTPRFIRPGVTTISLTTLPSAQQAAMDVSLLHAESAISESGRTDEMLPSKDSLVRTQISFRRNFLQRFEKTGRRIHASATCKLTNEHREFSLSISQRSEIPAVFSLVVGLFVLSVAAFARNREVSSETDLNPIATPVTQVSIPDDESANKVSHTSPGATETNSAAKSPSGVRPPENPAAPTG